MIWLGILAAAFLVGIYAQKGKGRIGAVWGLLTFLLGWVVFFACLVAVQGTPEVAEGNRESLELTLAIVTGIISAGIVGGIVATLPKRKPA